MKFTADLHVHSRFSRATARNLDLENLYRAALYKGITVVGTGDFTHPGWISEIEGKLSAAEPGLFRLKENIQKEIDRNIPEHLKRPVRFILQCEVSSIYKKSEKVRKIHNLIFFPDIDAVKRFNEKLDRIGNITSDGRPILGLPAENLLEITLETSERGFFIPAHIWTPWFSMFGSKSGFDTIQECFGSLSGFIFAVETGLSSDPPMNFRVADLDSVRLISSSDAHSPMYLGRNASVFTTDLSFDSIKEALESGELSRYGGTLDMFPQEGKYHYDGHRKCNVRMNPRESVELGNICPVCGKPLTLGVLNRVEQLAGRPQEFKPEKRQAFNYIVPLTDILSEIFDVGPKTKKVEENYFKAVNILGPELDILLEKNGEEIDEAGIPLLSEAIKRMRRGRVEISPGFDGEYGKVSLFKEDEKKALKGGTRSLFPHAKKAEKTAEKAVPKKRDKTVPMKKRTAEGVDAPKWETGLNNEQRAAVMHTGSPLIVQAGPGTGKTRTLTEKIAYLIAEKKVSAEAVLALTFTNKAAKEMGKRIKNILRAPDVSVCTATFHSFSLMVLREYLSFDRDVADEDAREKLIAEAASGLKIKPGNLDRLIQKAKQNFFSCGDDIESLVGGEDSKAFNKAWKKYEALLSSCNLVDYEDLITRVVTELQNDPGFSMTIQKRFSHIFVDEYQDINKGQYMLIRMISGRGANLTVIGDPDQSIYGFRGSDKRYFNMFTADYPESRKIVFNKNYRSTQTILDASFQVISGANPNSGKEKIVSDISGKTKLVILERKSEKSEAVAVGKMIEQLTGGISFFSMDSGVSGFSGGREFSFSDFAVLFRTRKQSRVFEEVFEKGGIPFQSPDKNKKKIGGQGEILNHDQDFLLPEAEKVSLMTIHAAKGLEFPVVFITGCEEGFIPFFRKGEKTVDISEEKRLFYVAMTRAKDILCLTYAKERLIFGKRERRKKSSFLHDIEESLKDYSRGGIKKKSGVPREKQMDLF